jgi:hypothetical protein
MSQLRVSAVTNLSGNGSVYIPGTVVQVQTVRSDSRTTIASNNSGDGTTITQLNLTITPKFANSKLIMQWMLNGEIGNDAVFLIHRNGSLITTAGATGYNSEGGNVRWSGVVSAVYDVDNNTTAGNYFIQYECLSGSTATQVFAPATRASGASGTTLYLNRTLASTGADTQEAMISNGTIWEIAQ